jgi:hypothetical protein
MPLKDGGVPAFLLGPFRTVGKVRQVAFFDHTVQGFIANVHLLHHFLHGNDDFV